MESKKDPNGVTFRDEIREMNPKATERACRSPKSAIRLFCIECMGGSRKDAMECKTTDCFLYPHRAGWRNEKSPAVSGSHAGFGKRL